MSEEETKPVMEETPGYLEAQKTVIHYTRARFHRRVFANLFDFIVFALTFLGLFVALRAIIIHTPDYQQKEETLVSIRLDSGMYRKNASGRVMDTVSFLSASENNLTGFAKMVEARDTVDKFIVFIEGESGSESANKVRKDYDEYRLNEKLVYDSVHYFVLSEGEIIRNPDCKATADIYFEKAYAPFIDEHCQGYLVTLVPRYLDLVRYESTILFAAETLPAYAAAPLLTHLMPMLIFRRGRMTFGKTLYHVGTVDRNLLVPTLPRTFARFAIFYFAEVLLSPFTFAIPLLFSASLMAFSHGHQSLPDYFLGLNEVDVSNDKIYFSREEILTSGISGAKKPVDFHPTYED